MPIARFQMPDGRIARFEVPEGTSPEDAQRMMEEASGSVAAPPKDKFSIGDTAKSFGQGALGAGKALTDIFGAGNAASQLLGAGSDALQASKTQGGRDTAARLQARSKAAEATGSVKEEAKAAIQNLIDSPVQATAQGLGSVVPFLATGAVGGALKLGTTGMGVLNAALGAGIGAGAVKGSIYDAVYEASIGDGFSKPEAEKRAAAAQTYAKNPGQTALGAALGVAASRVGAEKLVTPGAEKMLAPGMARRVATEVAKDVPLEAMQGGQERLAGNLGLQQEGYATPTWQGVVGQGVQEGLTAGMSTGAVAAARSPRAAMEEKAAAERARLAQEQQAAEAAAAAQKAEDQKKPEYVADLDKRYQDFLAQKKDLAAKIVAVPKPTKGDPSAELAYETSIADFKEQAEALHADNKDLIAEHAARRDDIEQLRVADAQKKAAEGVPEQTGAIAAEDSGETYFSPGTPQAYKTALDMHAQALVRAGEAARAGDFDAAEAAQNEATHHAEVANTLQRMLPPDEPPKAPKPRDPAIEELNLRLQQLQGGMNKKGKPTPGLYEKALRTDPAAAKALLAEMRQIQKKLKAHADNVGVLGERADDTEAQTRTTSVEDYSAYLDEMDGIDQDRQEKRQERGVDLEVEQMQAARMNTGKTEQVSLFPAEPSKTHVYGKNREDLIQAFKEARRSKDRPAMERTLEDIRQFDDQNKGTRGLQGRGALQSIFPPKQAEPQQAPPGKMLATRVSPLTGNAVEATGTPRTATKESVQAQITALPAKLDPQTESLVKRVRDNLNAFTADPARTEMAAEWLHGVRTGTQKGDVAGITAELDRLEQGKRSETEGGKTAVQGDLLDGVPTKGQTITNKNGISGELDGEEAPTRGQIFDTPEAFLKYLESDALQKLRAAIGPVRKTLAQALQQLVPLQIKLNGIKANMAKLQARQGALIAGKDKRNAETRAQLDKSLRALEQARADVEAEMAPSHANVERLRAALEDSARKSAEISATIDSNIARFGGDMPPEVSVQAGKVLTAKRALLRALNKEVTKANWDTMRAALTKVEREQRKLSVMQNENATDHRMKRFLAADMEAQAKLSAEVEHALKLRTDMQGMQELIGTLRTQYEKLHAGRITAAEKAVADAERASQLAKDKNGPALNRLAEQQRSASNAADVTAGKIKEVEASVGRTEVQRARDAAAPEAPVPADVQKEMDRIAADRATRKPGEITPEEVDTQMAVIAKERVREGQPALADAALRSAAEAVLKDRLKQLGVGELTQAQLRAEAEESLANKPRQDQQKNMEAFENPTNADGTPMSREQIDNEKYREARDRAPEDTQRDLNKERLRATADNKDLPQTTRDKAQRLWLKLKREDDTRESTEAAKKQIEKVTNETLPRLEELVAEADVNNPTPAQKKLLASRRKELTKARQEVTRLARLVQRGKRTKVEPKPSANTTLMEGRAANAEAEARREQLKNVEIPKLRAALVATPSDANRKAVVDAVQEMRSLTALGPRKVGPLVRDVVTAGNVRTGDTSTADERKLSTRNPATQGGTPKRNNTKLGKAEQKAANKVADTVGVTTPVKPGDKQAVADATLRLHNEETQRFIDDKTTRLADLKKQLPGAEARAEDAEVKTGITAEARQRIQERPDEIRKLITQVSAELAALKKRLKSPEKAVVPEAPKEPQASREDAEAALGDAELDEYDNISETGYDGGFDGEYENLAYNKMGAANNGPYLSTEAIAAAHDGRILDVADDLAKNGSTPEIRTAAARLRPLLLRTKLAVDENIQHKGESVAGFYSPEQNKITMHPLGLTELDMIHEMTHAATDAVLLAPIDSLTPEQRKGRVGLEKMWQAASKRADLKGMHGASNVREFAAEVYSNDAFRAKLDTIGKPRTMLDYIKSFFRMLLGQPTPPSGKAKDFIEQILSPSRKTTGVGAPSLFSTPAYSNDLASFGKDLSHNRSVVADLKATGLSKLKMALEQKLIDQRATLRKVSSIGDTLTGTQVKGDLLSADKALQNGMAVMSDGAFTLTKDAKGLFMMKAGGGPNAKAVFDHIAELPGKSAAEKLDLFQAYVTGKRAQDVGWDKLDYNDPVGMQKRYDAAMAKLDPVTKAQLERAQDAYHAFNKGLVQFLKDTNAVPDAIANEMMADRNYIPMFRNRGDSIDMVTKTGKDYVVGDIRRLPFLHALNTGDQKVMPFEESLLKNATMLTNLGVQNMTNQHIAYHMQGLGRSAAGDKKPMQIRRGKGGATDGATTLRFRTKPEDSADDGERHIVLDTAGTAAEHIPTDLLAQAVAGSYHSVPALLGIGKFASDILRAGVTRMPTYVISQTIKDPLNAAMMGNLKADPFTATMKTLNNFQEHLMGNTPEDALLMRHGVLQSQIFSGSTSDVKKMLMQIAGKNQSVYRQALAKLDRVAMSADAATRLQGYRDVIKAGGSELEAVIHAQEMQNFSKRGSSQSIQIISQLVPFFNAQLQGLNVLFKSASGGMPSDKLMKTKEAFFRRALGMTAIALVAAAQLEDDPEWEKLSLYTKLSNIPIGNGMHIPAPFESGFMFWSLPIAFMEALKDNFTSNDWADVRRILSNQLPGGGSIMPQAAKGAVDVVRNYNSAFGSPIESVAMQRNAVQERYAANTPEAMKLMSRHLVDMGVNLSPVQISYLANAYLGQLPHMVGLLTNSVFETKSQDKDTGEKPTGTAHDNPLLARFTRNQSESRHVNNAYAIAKKALETSGTVKKMVEDGRKTEAAEYQKEQIAKYGTAQQATAFTNQMGFLTRKIASIKADAKLSADEKQAQIEAVYAKKNDMAKAWLARIEARAQ